MYYYIKHLFYKYNLYIQLYQHTQHQSGCLKKEAHTDTKITL
jgi:hypothetical protein